MKLRAEISNAFRSAFIAVVCGSSVELLIKVGGVT